DGGVRRARPPLPDGGDADRGVRGRGRRGAGGGVGGGRAAGPARGGVQRRPGGEAGRPGRGDRARARHAGRRGGRDPAPGRPDPRGLRRRALGPAPSGSLPEPLRTAFRERRGGGAREGRFVSLPVLSVAGAAALGFYTYVGYPLALKLLAPRREPGAPRD